MKLKRTLKGQRGFSLLELVVALTLLAVISGGIMMAFDGSRSRAQALISSMSELGNAQLRLKNDTGCFVNMPVALFDRTAALDAANNYCNRAFANTWNGPYINAATVDAGGTELLQEKIGADVTMTFDRAAGGIGRQYFIVARNLPDDVARQALQECNGLDPEGDPLVSGIAENAAMDVTRKCAIVEALGGDDPKTIRMLFNSTR